LTERDQIDLQEAEDLTKRFLAWDIDEDHTDVMDVLRDLIDEGEDQEYSSELGSGVEEQDVMWDRR